MKYELTLTLKPTMYSYKPQDQFNLTRDILFGIFYPNNIEHYGVTCIAELTSEHNVHYHCLLELKSLKQKDKLLNAFRKHNKIFGRKTCEQVKYEESYKEYIIKDLKKTREIITDPIVCDYYGLASMKFIAEVQERQSKKDTGCLTSKDKGGAHKEGFSTPQ